MQFPFVSFIIPLFNHLPETQEMLKSLLVSMPPSMKYEIIFVDDGSTDGTREWLQSLTDPVFKVILNSSNQGYAVSNNSASRQARGEVLALLNNDLQFEPGWLEPMLELLMDPYLNAGMVGNVQYTLADARLDHAGIVINLHGKFDHLRELDETRDYAKVLGITGACVVIRKDDFDALGGFDESFRNGGEDCDLCFRVREAGKSIYVSLKSRIRHHVGLSRKGSSLQDEKNSRLLQQKWRSEIKFELTTMWAALLSSRDTFQPYLDGEVCEQFIETPYAASRIIAENILRRQEHYWERLVDGTEPNLALPSRFRVTGLTYDRERQAYRPMDEVRFELSDVYSARNFYVCGYTFALAQGEALELILTVNGAHRKRLKVGAEQSINFGIVNPLLLPNGRNTIVLNVSLPKGGQPVLNNELPLALTHIVVDDRKFTEL